jgi:isochorismate pyruvate lyase
MARDVRAGQADPAPVRRKRHDRVPAPSDMPAKRRPPSTLAMLRHEIESIDRQIVLLLAARLDAAGRAIRVRTARPGPITDRSQEVRIVERSRAWAAELGLPPTLVDNLFRSLVEEGKARFLRGERPPESPGVTVLLAPPRRLRSDLGDHPNPELLPIPAAR